MHKASYPDLDLELLSRHGGYREPGAERIVDCSVSLNPLGPPGSVLQALRRELPEVEHYPDPCCRLLIERLASLHEIESSNILIGNGSNELIHLIVRALRPTRVAIVEPTYTEYVRASRLTGAAIDHWLPEDGQFTPLPFDSEDAELVWLCNPNNPTGRLWPREQLFSWIAAFPRCTFVVDEAFMPFLPDEAMQSMIPALAHLDNLIVLRSMTKIYALPGLRLGYLAAAKPLVDRMRQHVIPWSVNSLAQAAGLAALEDEEYLARTHLWIANAISEFTDELRRLAPFLGVLPTCCNFVLVKLRDMSAASFSKRMLERGIAVRDASNFVGLNGRHVRLAVQLPAINQQLVVAMRSICGAGFHPAIDSSGRLKACPT